MKNQKISFAFVDEVGNVFDENQPFFGVGVFVIQDTILLSKNLHNVFGEALSRYKNHDDTFEFKFKLIKNSNADLYEKIIKILEKDKKWKFYCSFTKKTDLLKDKNLFIWETYINLLETILKKIRRKVVIVADYLNQPTQTKLTLQNLIKTNTNIENLLQLESQGSLLLQAADILLGGFNLNERKRFFKKEQFHKNKKKIASLIQKMSIKKEGMYCVHAS